MDERKQAPPPPAKVRSTRSTSTLCDEGETESEKIRNIQRQAQEESTFEIGSAHNRRMSISPLVRNMARLATTTTTTSETLPPGFLNPQLPEIREIKESCTPGAGPAQGAGSIRFEKTEPKEHYNPLGKDTMKAVCEEFASEAAQQNHELAQLIENISTQMKEMQNRVRVVSNAQRDMRQENATWRRGVLAESAGFAPTVQPGQPTAPKVLPVEAKPEHQHGTVRESGAASAQATINRTGVRNSYAPYSRKIFREDVDLQPRGEYSRPSRSFYRDRSRSRSHSPRRRGGMFGRPKGSREPGLQELEPADRRFNKLLSYRTYRLKLYSHTLLDESMEFAGGTKRFKRNVDFLMQYMPIRLTGTDPIQVLQFLSLLVTRCDQLEMDEQEAFTALQVLLAGDAKASFDAGLGIGDSAEDGIYNWPSAVQSLLRTFATDDAINEAVTNLERIKQQPNETETDYWVRLTKAHSRAGSYLDHELLASRFIEGLLPSIRPKLRVHRNRFRTESIMELVKVAASEGEAMREMRTTMSRSRQDGTVFPKSIRAPPKDRNNRYGQVNALATVGNDYWKRSDDSLDSSEYDVVCDQNQVLAVGPFSRLGIPRSNYRATRDPSRPGWKDGGKTVYPQPIGPSTKELPKRLICWRCYAVDSHYASGCSVVYETHGPVVVANFEALTREDQVRVPWGPYLMLKGYLTPDIFSQTGEIDNPFRSTVPNPSTPRALPSNDSPSSALGNDQGRNH